MTKPDVLFTIELIEEDKCSITFTTSEDVGSYLERLLKEGLFNRDLIENMIRHEYDHFYPPWINDDYYNDFAYYEDCNYFEDENTENDISVMAQWDDDYFEQFMEDKYLKYLVAIGVDNGQIERRRKLNKIRKVMKKNS